MAGGIGFISGRGGILDCLSMALYVARSKSSLSSGGPTRLSSPIQGCSYNQPHHTQYRDIKVTHLGQHLLQPPTPLLQRLDIPFRWSPSLCIFNISTFVSPFLTIRAFSIRFRVHRSFASYLLASTDIACSLQSSASYVLRFPPCRGSPATRCRG